MITAELRKLGQAAAAAMYAARGQHGVKSKEYADARKAHALAVSRTLAAFKPTERKQS
jgi:hypothetical protein